MADELKACPFCGGRAAYDEIEKTNETIVRCQGCYASGAPGGDSVRPDAPDPVAAEAWNRRPVEDALWAARAAAVARAEAVQAERDAAVARAEAAEAALLKARSAGARAERAAVIAYIRSHRDVADQRGGQHVGTGPNPAVQRFLLRILIPDLECGAHVPEPAPTGQE